MDECIYYTFRELPDGSSIRAWTYKKECPKCHKAKMGKPVVKGKVKIRAKEYVCTECGFTEEKVEHEDTLTVEIKYKCPHCQKEGETTTPFKRKSFQGVKAYIFTCNDCGEKIAITKKMASPKKKKKK